MNLNTGVAELCSCGAVFIATKHYDTLLDKFPELSHLCVIIIIFGFGLNIESYAVLPEFVCMRSLFDSYVWSTALSSC